MSLVSAPSAWDWAARLAGECDEPFDLVLREILAAVDRRDLSVRHPEDLTETWQILLPVMIERIDRDRRGYIDPEPVLGPGILAPAHSIIINAADLERWLSARGIEPRSAPASAKRPNAGRFEHIVVGPTSAPGIRTKRRPPSREKEFWPAAREAAVDWLTDNGCPAPNDGNQAALEKHVTEWLEDHRHEASESAACRALDHGISPGTRRFIGFNDAPINLVRRRQYQKPSFRHRHLRQVCRFGDG